MSYSSSKLVLPDNLKHLIGYFYGYTKTEIFSENQERQLNFIEYFRRKLFTCNVAVLINAVYPKFYDLLDLVSYKSETNYDLIIPKSYRPSKQILNLGCVDPESEDDLGDYRLVLIDSGFKVEVIISGNFVHHKEFKSYFGE